MNTENSLKITNNDLQGRLKNGTRYTMAIGQRWIVLLSATSTYKFEEMGGMRKVLGSIKSECEF